MSKEFSNISVTGLGYIGLPTAAVFADSGRKVVGVDTDERVVKTVNSEKIHIVEPELDKVVSEAVSNGYLKASIRPCVAEVYLIVVPTPFKGNHEPDISFVEAATNEIIPLLKKGDLYIIESTSPVGTTEKMQKLIFSSRPELKGQIHIAYCPERVIPGKARFRFCWATIETLILGPILRAIHPAKPDDISIGSARNSQYNMKANPASKACRT